MAKERMGRARGVPVPPSGSGRHTGALLPPQAAQRSAATSSMPRSVPPKLPQPPVPPAAGAVLVVARGVLLVEVLMILLRRVELARGHDLRRDGCAQLAALLERLPRRLRQPPLVLVPVEDRRAVLASPVAELPARRHRVDVVPEHLEKPSVAHFAGIVHDPDSLRVPGPARRHLLVRRVLRLAASEA